VEELIDEDHVTGIIFGGVTQGLSAIGIARELSVSGVARSDIPTLSLNGAMQSFTMICSRSQNLHRPSFHGRAAGIRQILQ